MTLSQYLTALRKKVDGFEEYYRKERKKADEPKDWPLQMAEEEWNEQLIFFLDRLDT